MELVKPSMEQLMQKQMGQEPRGTMATRPKCDYPKRVASRFYSLPPRMGNEGPYNNSELSVSRVQNELIPLRTGQNSLKSHGGN